MHIFTCQWRCGDNNLRWHWELEKYLFAQWFKTGTRQAPCERIVEDHISRADAIRVKRIHVFKYKKKLGWEMGLPVKSSSYCRNVTFFCVAYDYLICQTIWQTRYSEIQKFNKPKLKKTKETHRLAEKRLSWRRRDVNLNGIYPAMCTEQSLAIGCVAFCRR